MLPRVRPCSPDTPASSLDTYGSCSSGSCSSGPCWLGGRLVPVLWLGLWCLLCTVVQCWAGCSRGGTRAIAPTRQRRCRINSGDWNFGSRDLLVLAPDPDLPVAQRLAGSFSLHFCRPRVLPAAGLG